LAGTGFYSINIATGREMERGRRNLVLPNNKGYSHSHHQMPGYVLKAM